MKTTNSNSTEAVSAVPPPLLLACKIFIATAIGCVLFVAHAAFIPVALALLMWLILSGPVEALHKRRIPRSLSAFFILLIVLSALIGIVSVMWAPAQDTFAQAPQTIAAVQKKLGPVAKAFNKVDAMVKSAASMGRGRAPEPQTVVAGESAPAALLDATGSAAAALLTFVIVTLFLLTGGPPMLARMTSVFVSNLQSSHVLKILEKVRGEVGHFYLATTFINIGLGLATGLVMWAWGMPTPYLWGALAAIANFIPYAGAATTLLVVTLVAMVSFDTLSHVVGVAASYVALSTIEGQIAQPLLVGRRMEINPLLIFLGLWFGGLFWGIAGIVLATPVLVTLKVIAENAKSGRSMMEFLGPNDQSAEKGAVLRTLKKSLQ